MSKVKLRPSHTVAFCRVALGSALFAAVALSPTFAAIADGAMYGWPGLLAYLAFALTMLWLAWRHWWLSYRWRHLAFSIDLAFAFAVLWVIEWGRGGIVSPFMAFFLYLVLMATLLWPPRSAMAIIAGIFVCYLALGLVMSAQIPGWDPAWYLRRLGFMIVVGGMIFWFGSQRPTEPPDRLEWDNNAQLKENLEVTARFILRHLHCRGLMIVWEPTEEPWLMETRWGTMGEGSRILAPVALLDHERLADGPLLFDARRSRGLQFLGGSKIRAVPELDPFRIENDFNPQVGIAVTIGSPGGSGWIIFTGIAGISVDHLRLVSALADEVGRAIERYDLVASLRQSDASRLRAAIARNLHDGVVQSLAGVRFRLGAMQVSAEAGQSIIGELANLQQALATEELLVAEYVSQLRKGEMSIPPMQDVAHLARVFNQAVDLWGVTGTFSAGQGADVMTASFLQEMEPLVREAVSNAVRHGRASHITLSLTYVDGKLHIEFADDGNGFADMEQNALPQSILERVVSLGGELESVLHQGNTKIIIRLPSGRSR